MQGAGDRSQVAQVTVRKACDVDETAKKEASMLEADYVRKVERRRDENYELTKQLRQQIAIAAAELKEIAAVHTKLKLFMVKTSFRDEVLKVSQEMVAAIKEVVE